jgi:hypothetical protein
VGIYKSNEYKQMGKLVNNTIATEICYDLEIGLRNLIRPSKYPNNQLIHLIESNTLPINEITEKNLPVKSSFIFHVDPKHTEVFFPNIKKDAPIQAINHTIYISKTITKQQLPKEFINILEKGHAVFGMQPTTSLCLVKDIHNMFIFTIWKLK